MNRAQTGLTTALQASYNVDVNCTRKGRGPANSTPPQATRTQGKPWWRPATALSINQLTACVYARKGDDMERNEAREILDDIKAATVDRVQNIEQRFDKLATDVQDALASSGRSFTTTTRLDDGGFESFGDFVYSCRFSPTDDRVTKLEQRALSEGVGISGGVMVPPQFKSQLLQHIDTTSVVLGRSRKIQPNPNAPDAPVSLPVLDYANGRRAGVTVTWIGEADTKPSTEPQFDEVTLQTNELACSVPLTDKLIRNAPQITNICGTLIADAMRAEFDDKFMQGSGAGEPLGILGHAATKNVSRNTASEFNYADAANMVGAALPGGSYTWVMSQTCLVELLTMTLADSSNTGVWQSDARSPINMSLLGWPIAIWEGAPTLGNEGDVCLLDLSYYLTTVGVPMSVDVSNSHDDYFVKNKSLLKAFTTIDGRPWLNSTITLSDGETEVSPFVVLE